LGEADRTGTISLGRHTDLILVDENPLVNVAGASKVAGVLVRGRWLGADEIRARMEQIGAGASRQDAGR
jgi:imidazolonepropionase-like amidohydrolase